MGWSLKPGDVVVRRDLHGQYGGRQYGGIGPSRTTPNVLLFTNPEKGHRHGYYDGWGDDGCFHYCGEGQVGDQRMVQGNLAILNHRVNGRALRLFRAVPGNRVQYVGEFELDETQQYYLTDAPETGNGPVRSVIMFRLRPRGEVRHEGAHIPKTPGAEPSITAIEPEEQRTERTLVDPAREPYEAERRESFLLRTYIDYIVSLGHKVTRHQISPAGEAKPLYTDLYDQTTDELIEAKGTVTREGVRMAIGQILDYSRYLKPKRVAVLLPIEPRRDLVALCQTLAIDIIWPDQEVWVRLSEREADDPKKGQQPWAGPLSFQ
ncbi:restriction endonuclease [Actinomadura sp. WMMA1423]|uniref:restriction endonuclease n=1 Tax=Actinomadura sp. WMMA1423 TaxID=2591108 RepID=UPI00197A7D87|nr:restriction endonuclease [Actinomadura sp. WMMA1423]